MRGWLEGQAETPVLDELGTRLPVAELQAEAVGRTCPVVLSHHGPASFHLNFAMCFGTPCKRERLAVYLRAKSLSTNSYFCLPLTRL